MATLFWHGFRIGLRSYQLQGEALRRIGINPNFCPKGVEVGLTTPFYFKSIRQIMGIGQDRLGGIYHPKLGKVLVPEDISQIRLCHEVLHAVFDAVPHPEREAFSRLVNESQKRAPESRFFKGVAQRTNGDRLFLTEVFAFGGSKVIFERMGKDEVEKDLGAVPTELRDYFERNVVDPRLLTVPLQKIA